MHNIPKGCKKKRHTQKRPEGKIENKSIIKLQYEMIIIYIYICIYKVSQSIISHITTQTFEALQVIIRKAIM